MKFATPKEKAEHILDWGGGGLGNAEVSPSTLAITETNALFHR